MSDWKETGLYAERRYPRLKGFDYARGTFFVTICTHDKRRLFGEICAGSMKLSPYGEIATECWGDIPAHYRGVRNDVFLIMPNHVHGIVTLGDDGRRSGYKPDPTEPVLSEVVRAFKSFSARRINEIRKSQWTSVWQRSYYEHVIRSEEEYRQIGEYILNNPSKWEADPYRW